MVKSHAPVIPDVSVIIATYNVANYLQKAVKSALEQEGVSVEVIIVDDCSTDNTWPIVQSLQDSRIKIHKLTRNGGPSAARNHALTLAQGRWVAILDADDWFLPNRLQTLLTMAVHTQADIVADNLMTVREDNRAQSPMFTAHLLQAISPLSLANFIAGNQSFMGGWTLGYLKPIFSREFLMTHALHYSPDLRIGEDYLLFAQALAHGARCIINEQPLYAYLIRQGSISHRLSREAVQRIHHCDKLLLSNAPFDPLAMKAQRKRTKNLEEAYAFTGIIEAIKSKNIRSAIKIVTHCPRALRFLKYPLLARWERAWGKKLR